MGGKVHGQGFDGCVGFGLDFSGDSVEFGSCTGDEEGTVTGAGEVESIFPADTV